MKIRQENIIKVAEATSQLRCKKGAIKALAATSRCSTKTVSRALHGDKAQVGQTMYVSIRANAIRAYEGEPYEVRRLHL